MRRSRVSPFAAGVLVLAATALICWLAYFKSLPFHHQYELRAVFATANEIHPRDPVRIAGVEVGRVKRVEAQPDGDAAVVVMTIRDDGLPIHRDATLKVRPRMFLEGVFFVDLHPGTPSAPRLRDGDTVPVTQTAAPVQLDQPLSALQADTRARLRDTLRGAGAALGDGGGEAVGETLDASATALPNLALTADALAGTRDLRPLVADLGRVVGALGDSGPRLQALLSDLDASTATLACRLRLAQPHRGRPACDAGRDAGDTRRAVDRAAARRPARREPHRRAARAEHHACDRDPVARRGPRAAGRRPRSAGSRGNCARRRRRSRP